MTQFEFYKSFLFMLELLVAEALFLPTMKRRKWFVLRLLGAIAACFAFSHFFPLGDGEPFYMCFTFLCLFVFTVCAAKFVFKESWSMLLFACVAGYTVQHLAYQANNIATLILTRGSGDTTLGMYGSDFAPMFTNPFFTIIYFFLYIGTYMLSYYVFSKRLSSDTFELPHASCLALVGAILVVDIVLNAFIMHFAPIPVCIIVSGLYNIVCCLFGLFLQFQILLTWGLQSSLQMERVARRFEGERYGAVKEAMETINVKYHDLKYQEWKAKANKEQEKEAVSEESLLEYGRFTYTGNVALDIVLSEINRLCQKHSIRISYMTDGNLLSFMRDEDIYSLFGNLLNNAVEALMQCPEEQRTMGVRVESRCENLLNITVYNYCAQENFVFKDGLPQTTKRQGELHGFGLKSVRRICDKYEGTLDIYPENNLFNVSILFPIPKDGETEK